MQDPITFFNIEYLYQLIYFLITGDKSLEIFARLEPVWNVLVILGYILIVLFILGIVYSVMRLRQIRKAEAETLYSLTQDKLNKKKGAYKNERWDKIKAHAYSLNENDWRLAIIEADTILYEMMTTMGYHQETLGEKLKAVEKSDFNTIDKAWEAHKVRNAIAHEGSGFMLSQREAQRIIALYEDVFREFEYI